MNNSTRSVNPETRRRVREVARRMNYHPDAMARGLVHRRCFSLGVLMPGIESAIVTNHYAVGVLSGVFYESSARGYDIHVHTRPWESADVSASQVQSSQTDGTLVVAPPIGSDIVSGLRALDLPIVVVSTPTAVEGVPYVDTDNAAGARLVARHLLGLGHTRIAHLMGIRNQHSVFERRDAFVGELERSGVPVRAEYIVGDSFQEVDVAAAVNALLDLPEPPTALFAGNDDLAVLAIQVALERNVEIPGELSVIGFDDYPTAQQTRPMLTTVRQPLWEIGKRATQILIARIEEKDTVGESFLFAPQLVERGSTGPAPAS